MKRSIAVLILALALVLTACGGQKAANAQAEAEDITLCPTYDNGKGGYFSITLPAAWGDHYVTECGANDGGYYVGFYEKVDHDNGLGGFLFMLEVFPTDYDYTELPEYQAICGLTVDGANYNLIAELHIGRQRERGSLPQYVRRFFNHPQEPDVLQGRHAHGCHRAGAAA